MGCGPQCLFNMIFHNFAYGDRACEAEAYIHIVGMIIQFLCVSSISYRVYVGVVQLKPFTVRKALLFVAFIWVLAFAGTAIFGNMSPIYLVQSGTFCFYDWSSVALIAWAWPVAGIAAGCMVYWYYSTFKVVRAARAAAKALVIDGSRREADIAIKLSILVFLFVYGYSGVVCQSLYEVTVGRAKIWGDVTAAVIAMTYWVMAPFAYAHANSRLQIGALFCSPAALLPSTKQSTGKLPISLNAHPSQRTGDTNSKRTDEFSHETKAKDPASKELDVLDRILQDAMSSSGWGTSRMEGAHDDVSSEGYNFEREIEHTESTPFTLRPLTPLSSQLPLIDEIGVESPTSRKKFLADQENIDLEDSVSVRPIFNPFNSTTPEPLEPSTCDPTS